MPASSLTHRSRSLPDSQPATVAINAAFFEEVKEAHHELEALIKRIRRLCQPADWSDTACRELSDKLNLLAELTGSYFALEETYGYFEDPVFVNAIYSHRVSDLRAEHRNLLAEIRQLSDHAARLLYHGRLPDCGNAISARFSVFADQFERHEFRERELITEGFSVDLGCVD
jgi:hypothetical protein